MVVDDSAVVRGLETRILEGDPAISVIASVGNGQAAVQALDRHPVEVIVLDIEMPVMDGITALPLLLKKAPHVKIVISSTLTLRNAEISLKALEAGASDYVTKPSSSRELTGGLDFKTELIEKVKALGEAARKAGAGPAVPGGVAARPAQAPAQGRPAAPSLHQAGAKIVLRPAATERPEIVAIGSSTGGPQALFAVLGGLKKAGGVAQPILITQHMPATFTTILADHINRLAGMPAKEAEDGEPVQGGRVYIAPGDWHMLVATKGTNKVIRLTQDPPENFCRPAVDPMFRSVAQAYGRRVLAVVLTGMGSDGARGGKVIAEAGGTVIAQDEATSVVWGMPGATAQNGACSAVLPLPEIAPYIHKFANRRV